MMTPEDSSYALMYFQEACGQFTSLASELFRPSYLLKPKVYPDGNKWCALYGENIQDGVCGFGDSPEEAFTEFDKEWYKKV